MVGTRDRQRCPGSAGRVAWGGGGGRSDCEGGQVKEETMWGRAGLTCLGLLSAPGG